MVSQSDYAWLSSQGGQVAWHLLLESATPHLGWIRSATSAKNECANLLLEQLLFARGKARAKVEDPDRWFWTKKLLEQASDEWTALETALDAPPSASRWLDVCCGAGVDCVALARRRPGVMGIDAHPIPLLLARANAIMNQVDVELQECQAETLSLEPNMYLNIDPDRRADGKRTIDPIQSQPSWSWIAHAVRRCAAVSLKLAPGLRARDDFDWGEAGEPHAMRWLSWHGEVRQQRWYWGIDRWPQGTRIASAGSRTEGWHHEIFPSHSTRASTSMPQAIDDVSLLASGYVADQDPVVRAASLGDLLADRLGIRCLGDRNGYCHASRPVHHPMLRWFHIIDVLPLDARKIRATARRMSARHWELKSRGVDLDLDAMQRQLPTDSASDQRFAILFTRLGKKHIAIFAQRQERELA